MAEIIVIGAGPAGMMAAWRAGMRGHAVTILEHNEKAGKKLFITGKGRCNVTNDCETEDFFGNVPRNYKFLYSAVYGFGPAAVMDYFTSHGVPLKTERGQRVFPVSDHSSDIIAGMRRGLEEANVSLQLGCDVKQILVEDGRACGVRYMDRVKKRGRELYCDAVIIASGGLSYPATGSDGSGFSLVSQLGHSVTPMRPSLVPMNVREDYVRELQGLSLKNVEFTVLSGKKKLFSEFGEMLFTHFGISGPLVLTASSRIADKYFSGELQGVIDLKPALNPEQLDRRILRDFEEGMNRQFKNSLGKLLPAKLIPAAVALSGIDPEKKLHSVTQEERRRLTGILKAFPLTITGLRGYDEAVITRGGIPVREVDASTMESKVVPGLYLCGEMLDVDAVTGGFNLQIAWSTGWLAGDSVCPQ